MAVETASVIFVQIALDLSKSWVLVALKSISNQLIVTSTKV